MAINCQTQTAAYTRRVARIKTQSLVEIKISAQDIGEVVAVYPQVSPSMCEVSSGRVNYGGRLICTLIYADEEGKLCRVQKGAEFSHYADSDELAPAQRCDCALKCEKFQIKRDGSHYLAAVVIGAEIDVFDVAQRTYIIDIDGAVCKKDSVRFLTMQNFSGECEVEDSFDCVAGDVLVPSASALVTGCKAVTGMIEVSGEIYLSLLAVRDKSPVSLNRIIPFKCELPCEDSLLSKDAYCRADIKSLNAECKVNEEKSRCDVDITATLAFCGRFFEEEQVQAVTDAFSKDCELVLGYGEECEHINTNLKVYTEKASGLCAAKAKIDYTCAFLAAVLPQVEFVRTVDGIEGGVSATLIYEQGGDVRATEVNMPFALTLQGLSGNCTDVSVAVCALSLRQRAEGECEAEAVFKITAADGDMHYIKYLKSAEQGAEKKACDCAVSVYLPQAGDGLWETAKRLSEEPDSIAKSNPELSFPLTGKERILVYRAKKG